MSSFKAYARREAAIGVLINLAIGSAFFFGVFGGQAAPAVWGAKGLIVDCLPQGFMVGLMSIIPAMLITTKRARSGLSFQDLPANKTALPRNIFLRGVATAVLSLIGLVAVAAGLAAATGVQSLPFWVAFGLKSLPALVISSLVIPPALAVAFHDARPAQPATA